LHKANEGLGERGIELRTDIALQAIDGLLLGEPTRQGRGGIIALRHARHAEYPGQVRDLVALEAGCHLSCGNDAC